MRGEAPPYPPPCGDLLDLVQWLSPAFPVGGFAYSHGLEWAIAEREVICAASLQRWLEAALQHGAGRNDAILCSLAMRGHDPVELAELAEALAPTRERLEEVRAMGAAFTRTLNALSGRALAPMAVPVALGVLGREMALPPAVIIALLLQAFAGNLVTIAVRFVPLGQTEGQQVLAALHATIRDTATFAGNATRDDLGGAFFRGDMASAWHETKETRIFRT
ncbi:MAG: urease accessory protein UreF [Rhodobacteraceae bacterium HLUCCA12]|nr:MAG: urease accessory protein UreF [Rhodobacteraceae bacterium HLUCCA12]